jgi:hypothetical protein
VCYSPLNQRGDNKGKIWAVAYASRFAFSLSLSLPCVSASTSGSAVYERAKPTLCAGSRGPPLATLEICYCFPLLTFNYIIKLRVICLPYIEKREGKARVEKRSDATGASLSLSQSQPVRLIAQNEPKPPSHYTDHKLYFHSDCNRARLRILPLCFCVFHAAEKNKIQSKPRSMRACTINIYATCTAHL